MQHTRVTDAVHDRRGAAAHHQYGTITPINANDTYINILLENGSMEIVHTSGGVIVPFFVLCKLTKQCG